MTNPAPNTKTALKECLWQGWVAIHEMQSGQAEKIATSLVPPAHLTHLGKFALFAGTGRAPSFSSSTEIASMGSGEAVAISMLLSHVFVILTKSEAEKPEVGYLLKFKDWKRAVAGDVECSRRYLAALQVSRGRPVSFVPGGLAVSELVNLNSSFPLYGLWPADAWTITAGRIPPAELRLFSIEGNVKPWIASAGQFFPLEENVQRNIVVGLFHTYWRRSKLLSDSKSCAADIYSFSKGAMDLRPKQLSATLPAAGCRDLSASVARKAITALRKEMRLLVKGSYWDPLQGYEQVHWLLAPLEPELFSEHMLGGLENR